MFCGTGAVPSCTERISRIGNGVLMINKLGDDVNYLGPDGFAKFWLEKYKVQRELSKIFKK